MNTRRLFTFLLALLCLMLGMTAAAEEIKPAIDDISGSEEVSMAEAGIVEAAADEAVVADTDEDEAVISVDEVSAAPVDRQCGEATVDLDAGEDLKQYEVDPEEVLTPEAQPVEENAETEVDPADGLTIDDTAEADAAALAASQQANPEEEASLDPVEEDLSQDAMMKSTASQTKKVIKSFDPLPQDYYEDTAKPDTPPFPKTVTATLQDGSKVELAVTWSVPSGYTTKRYGEFKSYCMTTDRNYTLASGVSWPSATLNVIAVTDVKGIFPSVFLAPYKPDTVEEMATLANLPQILHIWTTSKITPERDEAVRWTCSDYSHKVTSRNYSFTFIPAFRDIDYIFADTGVSFDDGPEIIAGMQQFTVIVLYDELFEIKDNKDLTVTVTGCKDNTLSAITIPNRIAGCRVTGIDAGVFGNCTKLTDLTVPDCLLNVSGSMLNPNCQLQHLRLSVCDNITLLAQDTFANTYTLALNPDYAGVKLPGPITDIVLSDELSSEPDLELIIACDFTVPEGCSISEGQYNRAIRKGPVVKAGCTLTNKGTITAVSGGLENYGTINNAGSFVNGKIVVYNYGVFNNCGVIAHESGIAENPVNNNHVFGTDEKCIICGEGNPVISDSGNTTPSETSAELAPEVPASVAAPAPAPETSAPATPVYPAIVATSNTKTAVSANPGTTYTLDLGGQTGKNFKSSNKKVATVDQSGNVLFKKAGKTKITFKVGKKKRTVSLTVKDPTIPTSVSLTTPTTAVKKGDSITLSPVIPEGTNTSFKWKSSNKKVATVNNDGVVTFKKPGKVTITATAKRGKKKAKMRFTVGK